MKEITVWAVSREGIIDRFYETYDMGFYAIFRTKAEAVRYNKSYGPQKIVKVKIRLAQTN